MSRFASENDPGVPSWFREPLTAAGWRIVQRKLGLLETGAPDPVLYAAVSGFQKARHLPATGEVDRATAARLGPSASEGFAPDWWIPKLAESREAVARYLQYFDRDIAWLKRLQGNHGLEPTGLIDRDTASVLDIEI